MSALTENEIRALAKVRSNGSPITSCYLDVDGARFIRPDDYERVLDTMMRTTRDAGIDETTERDLARIEERVRAGFDRSTTRGIALFASGAHDLWEVIELPVSVRSELVVNQAPSVGQLEAVVQQATTIGVLAVDKANTRVFVFRLGELVEHVESRDDLGRDYDTTGEHDRGGVADHREELEHQHVRNAASAAWSAHQQHGFDHVVVAVSEPVASEFERSLHPYLRERLHGRLGIEPSAPVSAIRDAALAAAERIEIEREATLVGELRAAVGAGTLGVAGIDAVLDAMADQRVDRLVVSDGFVAAGWHCGACGRLATVGRECACGEEMVHVADVVELAVDEALARSCKVDVCIANADLDVMGRIGALLRY